MARDDGPPPLERVEQQAADEFDQWAKRGWDAEMERGHGGATRSILDGWKLKKKALLDVGCGNGWAVREAVRRGAVGTGVDVAPEMVARARVGAGSFQIGSAQSLPFEKACFDFVLNVENLYYLPRPAKALNEWARVTRTGGRLGVMIDLYEGNPAAEAWIAAIPFSAHVLSQQRLGTMATGAGWRNVSFRRFVDSRPVKSERDFEADEWYPTYAIYQGARRAGSLILEAQR